jgi:cytochrome c-type biogenesis protein CcmE
MVSPQVKIGLGVALVLGVIVWMGLSGIQAGKTYYMTAPELIQMQDEAFEKRLRVAGFVEEGSIRRQEGQLHFRLTYDGVTVPVIYTGNNPVPDTFKDGVNAVVEGRYLESKTFEADHIQAKCASKYEAGYEISGEKATS